MIAPEDEKPTRRRHLPLYAQVLIGVVLGATLGVVFRTEPFLFGMTNQDLGRLGLLVIRLLKALAIPLLLFAVVDAFARTRISARAGGRLVLICLVNVTVAMTIGLTIMNTLRPGEQWRGQINELIAGTGAAQPAASGEKPEVTLNPLKNIDGWVPTSLVEPFLENSVIPVVLLAVLAGAALRRVKDEQEESGESSIRTVEAFVAGGYQVLIKMLDWVVHTVPFAVFGAVASVVGEKGLGTLAMLWIFLVTILLGLLIHGLIYYPLMAWLVGKKTPREYLGGGADAILTGLSINSSLASVPLTLRCLTERMGVSESSARLAACVGTNLNNDGITLYDAMAALFLAQAVGMSLGLGQQMMIVLASIMAGIGIAGVPEAGLIVLPLVLSAAGLPEGVVLGAIPLILTVDWIIARVRSAVNVMCDMLVAILLDAGQKK